MAEGHQGSLGKRLRQERELRHWTQEQLAEKIGRSVPSINRWEHDRADPQADALQELTALFGKPPDRWGLSRWNVPYLRNPYFTGREHLLASLHRTLAAEHTVTSSQARAISGLGGIGKTQLAIEYAYRYAREYEAVLWVSADSPEVLVSEFAGLAQTLDLPDKEEKEQWRIVSAVKRWLQEHTGWLLILDNADDLTTITDFLPRGVSGATLMTTRSQVTGKIARNLSVDKMEMAEGLRFLLRRATLLTEDEPLETVSAATRTAAQQVVEELDGLPLALDQAGAYIEETGCSLSEYLALYRQYRLALLKRESSTASEYPYTVASTWTLSFSHVEQANAAAADLLRLCAFLHPDAIPEEIMIAGAAVLGPLLQEVATDPLRFHEAIQLLRRYSLVKRDAEIKLLNLHRLVQLVLKESLDAPTQRLLAERAIRAVNAAFPQVEHSVWPQCERLLSQALIAAQLIEQYGVNTEEAGRLLHETAGYLSERVRYTEAEVLYQQALRIRELKLGPEHSDVAQTLNNLANLYREQGKYAQAELSYQRALHISEQHLGPGHPRVAKTLNNLANLSYDQGKYAQAESLYQRAVSIWENLGPEQYEVAYPLNNLANLYWQQGKYEKAEPIVQRVLRIWELHLGPQHSNVGNTLNILANLYYDQEMYGEAEPLYRRALGIFEQQLGPEHPSVAFCLNGLANVYNDQEKYEQAEPLYQQALRIWEQQVGETHPHVAHPLNGLANLYTAQRRYREAEPLYQRALSLWEQMDSEHVYAAYQLSGLAELYSLQGRYAEAKPLYQRALHILEQKLGSEHLDVAKTMHDFARYWEAQGNNEEARSLYTHALAIFEQVLGTQHLKTMQTRTRLIAVLTALGQHEEATHLEAAPSEQRTREEAQKAHSEE